MNARTQSAFRSLSRWRISTDADVAPGSGRADLNIVSSHFSPIVSRNCVPSKRSGVVTEILDRTDESSTSGTTALTRRVSLNATLVVT